MNTMIQLPAVPDTAAVPLRQPVGFATLDLW
jgi:hypothetical protein